MTQGPRDCSTIKLDFLSREGICREVEGYSPQIVIVLFLSTRMFMSESTIQFQQFIRKYRQEKTCHNSNRHYFVTWIEVI